MSDKLKTRRSDRCFFFDFPLSGLQRLFAPVKATLWQLPRTRNIGSLQRQNLSVAVDEDRADPSPEVLSSGWHLTYWGLISLQKQIELRPNLVLHPNRPSDEPDRLDPEL